MLRAGPFSDPRLHLIINNRFVPFYLDLSSRGFVPDADGRAFVVKRRPELGGRSVPTPPVLFFTGDGVLKGEVSNYADADRMLTTIRQVAKQHAGTRAPSAHEAQDPIDHALVEGLLAGAVTEEVDALLAEAEDQARAGLARARLLRWLGALPEAQTALAALEDSPAVALERAWLAWRTRSFAEIPEHLSLDDRAIRKQYEAAGTLNQARYLLGLGRYADGQLAGARKEWASLVKEGSEDSWAYRADWAYVQSKRGTKSLLGRIGYMGSTQPDLAHADAK